MPEAFICDGCEHHWPLRRGLSPVRPDDLGAVPLTALMSRHPDMDWSAVDDVWFGCANQAAKIIAMGRMSALLAGLPEDVPAVTLNRLCGSGMDAIGSAARAIRSGEIHRLRRWCRVHESCALCDGQGQLGV